MIGIIDTPSVFKKRARQLIFRQVICDGLKAAGFDVSGLSDPLGLVVDAPIAIEPSQKLTELDAESVQITIRDSTDDLEKLKKPLISFNDIFKAYRSVPQDWWGNCFLKSPFLAYHSFRTSQDKHLNYFSKESDGFLIRF